MANIIAIANQKGGVSKTTSTFNISTALANYGKNVLMIDLDPQASLTISCGIEPYEIQKNLANCLDQKKSKYYIPVEECIIKLKENLSIVTSSIDLASLEMEMLSWTSREKCLDRMLSSIQNQYDYIIVDCPPQLSMLTLNALSAASYVLIPCKTDYMAFRGLENLVNTIADVQELLNPNLKIMGVIATLFNSSIKDDKEVLKLLEKKYKVLSVIKLLAAAKKGVCEGIATVDKFPSSQIAIAYNGLAKKIIEDFK